MAKWHKSADSAGNRLSYLWTIFGPGGLLAAVMTAFLSGVKPLTQFGWGAIPVAAILLACIFMLAASAGMVAWRYFHPLSHFPEPLAPISSAPASTEPGALPAARQPIATVVADEVHAQLQLVSEQLARMDHTLFLLASVGIDAIENDVLAEILSTAPDPAVFPALETLTLETMASHFKELNGYCYRARNALRFTKWGFEFDHAVKQAAAQSENELTATGRVPTDIGPYEYRKYFILRAEARAVVGFLRPEKEDADRAFRSYRSQLQGRRDMHAPNRVQQ